MVSLNIFNWMKIHRALTGLGWNSSFFVGKITALFFVCLVKKRGLTCSLRALSKAMYVYDLGQRPRWDFESRGAKSSLRWKQLYYSFHIGNSSKNEKACFQKFLTCTFDLPQLINVPVLHLWQLASNFIDIRLDDN